jgi:ribose 1,5-bisphosphokinase
MNAGSPSPRSGLLVVVVGPSGAGKDTLIAEASRRLAGDGRLMVVRRVVTRAALPSAEDHDSLNAEAFEAAERAGRFAVCWSAHGLRYGIPTEARIHVAAGGTAIVNGSRAALAAIRDTFEHVLTVLVTAEPEVLARRLAARRRESEADIAQRLRRTPPDLPDGPDIVRIDNGGDLGVATDAFIAALADGSRRT